MKKEIEELEDRFKYISKNPLLADRRDIPAFGKTIEDVKSLTDIELSKLMKHWMLEESGTLETFLMECSSDSSISHAVAKGFSRDLDFWSDPEIFENEQELVKNIDAIFLSSFELFPPPVRDWIAERPGVYSALSLTPGVDFIPFQGGDGLNVKDEDLPPVDTVKGVQYRLARYLYLDEITGLWDEKTARAIFRLQLEYEHPEPSGKIDSFTMELLTQEG